MPSLGNALGLPYGTTAPRGGGGALVPPDPPTNLTAGTITDDGATLSWTAPAGGATVTGYDIEVQETGGDWSAPVFTSTSATALISFSAWLWGLMTPIPTP